MTLSVSGAMTGQLLRDELRQASGNIVLGDARTRWLAGVAAAPAPLKLPDDFYGKTAVKLVDTVALTSPSNPAAPSVSLGADYTGRQIVLVIYTFTTANQATVGLTGLTINGASATSAGVGTFQATAQGSVAQSVAIATLSGTTATLGITTGASVQNIVVLVYSIAGVPNTKFDGLGSSTSSANTLSLNTVDVPANGVFLVSFLKPTSGTITAFTGANIVADTLYATNFRLVSAFINRLPSQTDRPCSISWNSTGPAVMSCVALG